MRVVGIVIFICAVLGATSGFVQTVCEHGTLDIDCGSSKTIVIRRATYGRHSVNICRSIHVRTTRCHARSSMTVLTNHCNGKQKCTVKATNTVFGDPCRGTRKYLWVIYSCKQNAISLPLSSNIADTREICQKQTSIISCPGKRIIVLRAYYGRRSKGICPQTASKGRCYRNVTFTVRRICHKKPECTLQANNSKYGTRCAGTYLILKYKCV